MKRYWSPSTKGHYNDKDHRNIPEDKIEVTEEEYQAAKQNPDRADIGPSGRLEVKPSQWETLNQAGDDWEITEENQALKDSSESEQSRIEGITIERENSGLKKITVEQAYTFIDNKFDGVTTLAELIEANKEVWKKAIPHIID